LLVTQERKKRKFQKKESKIRKKKTFLDNQPEFLSGNGFLGENEKKKLRSFFNRKDM